MAKKKAKASSRHADVERRIHFYRADCGDDDGGEPVRFLPADSFKHLDGLDFAPFEPSGGRYFDDDGNVYCCWVESPKRARFAVIRRDAFPLVEEKGLLKALQVPAAAGLVEAIHVRVFPKNIVGFDFNFNGPRLPRLGTYLNTVAAGVCPDVVFRPLLRNDAVAELDDGKELRLFSLRVKRSHLDRVEEADKSVAHAFRQIDELAGASVPGAELEIAVRPQPYSGQSVGPRLMKATKRLARQPDIRDISSKFRVKAAEPGRAAAELDLLGDRFIGDARILKQTQKGRALDQEDAFDKIGEAHAERRNELEKAAALAVRQWSD